MAAIARSGPAPMSITCSAAAASGEDGSLVRAIVGTPCRLPRRRRPTMSGDAPDWLIPITSARPEPGLHAVERQHGRRREPHREPEPDAEQVLGVDRGVVGRAAGGDHDVVHVPVPDRGGDALDGGRPIEEPGEDGGLLADLVGEAHAGTAVATGSRPWNAIAPVSAAASADRVGGRMP